MEGGGERASPDQSDQSDQFCKKIASTASEEGQASNGFPCNGFPAGAANSSKDS